MKTLVLGLGNPILGDDGVGLRVARAVGELAKGDDVTAVESMASGLALLDILAGYDRAVIVDAIQTGQGRVGDVYRLDIKDIDTTRHTASPHDATLTDALAMGAKLGFPIPKEISVVAVGIPDVCDTFSEDCSAAVEKAIPEAVKMVLAEIGA